VGRPIALSLKKIFEHSAKACKPPVQWKIARVRAAFKKGRQDMLQTSKFMESYVASNIIDHAATQDLLDDRQWAYKKGKLTKQLLIQKQRSGG